MESALRRATTARQRGDEESDAWRITLDFDGVEGISPKFFNELLVVFESLVGANDDGRKRTLIMANSPTRDSSKFEAVGRAHKMTVAARPDGSWLLTGMKHESE